MKPIFKCGSNLESWKVKPIWVGVFWTPSLLDLDPKADSDYSEEVHMKCTSQSRIYAQDKVIWVDGWYGRVRWKEKNNQKMSQFGVLWRSSLLVEGLRLPEKLDNHRTPLTQSVAMLTSMSCLLEILYQRGLGCSENLNRQRTYFFVASHIAPLP